MSSLTKAHSLISCYQTQYKNKYGSPTVVNRNKLQHLVANILKDLSVDETKQLIDFYLETDVNPNLAVFCYEYDEILERKLAEARDLAKRKSLLAETQKTVEEFRRRYGAG